MNEHARPKNRIPGRIHPLIALVFAFGLIVASVLPVAAHARLEETSIAPGAILPAVPPAISLTFTEAIDPAFSSASLIAPDQTVMSAVTITRDGSNDRVGVFDIVDAASLPAGSYALLWRVVSAVDGHTTTGVLAFSAGTGAAPEIASSSEASGGNWSGTLGRWLELAALMAMAGAALLALVTGDPAGGMRLIVRIGLPVALVGAIITALNLFGSASGAGFGSWPGADRAADVLFDSTPGRALVIRVVMLALVAVIAFALRAENRRAGRVAIAGATLTSLATFSFIGHAAGLRGNFAIATDLAHLFSATVWSGGLLLVALMLMSQQTASNDGIARVVGRFSAIAFSAFLIVGATGLVGAWFNVAGPRNLTGEDYGRVLILKTLLALLILSIAAVNRSMLVPNLRRADADRSSIQTSLRKAALIELGLAVAVLLLAARLTSIPPADAPLTVDVAARSGAIALTGVSNDLEIAVDGELSNRPEGVIRVTITEAATGAPALDLVRVIVDARAPDPLDPDGEPLQDRFEIEPVDGTPGVWELPRTRLGLEAEWSIEVIARRLGVVDEAVSFTLDLRHTAPPPPRLVQEEWRLPRLPWGGYLALVAAAATVAGSLILIRRLKGLEPVTAGIMLTVAAMITIGFLLSAWRSGPIPVAGGGLVSPANLDDPAAIQRAVDTWAMQCASCHGVDGGGTGERKPDGSHAHASVAGDLLGPQSRARTPEELLWIISNGLGGTSMPAFDLALTDEERADLVSYLRWLQSRTTP